MTQTIAQQLGVNQFPFTISDVTGKIIYYENSIGFCIKFNRDRAGALLSYQSS
jgi:hypothetical protein